MIRIQDLLLSAALIFVVMIPMAAGAWLYHDVDTHYQFTHGPGCPAPTYET